MGCAGWCIRGRGGVFMRGGGGVFMRGGSGGWMRGGGWGVWGVGVRSVWGVGVEGVWGVGCGVYEGWGWGCMWGWGGWGGTLPECGGAESSLIIAGQSHGGRPLPPGQLLQWGCGQRVKTDCTRPLLLVHVTRLHTAQNSQRFVSVSNREKRGGGGAGRHWEKQTEQGSERESGCTSMMVLTASAVTSSSTQLVR